MPKENTVSNSEKGLRKIFSAVVIVAMVIGGLAATFASMNVSAAITLTVTGTDKAPPEGVFPGDNNITMLWLELQPADEDVDLYSLTFDLTAGSTVADADVTRIFVFIDYDGNGEVDQFEIELQANFGVLVSQSQPFTFPVTLTTSYTVLAFNPDYFLVFIDVDTGTEGEKVGIELAGVSCEDPAPASSGTSSDVDIKTIIWSDEMESGVAGWQVEGGPEVFWHQTSKTAYLAYSPTTAWWYANETTGWYFIGPPPGVRNYGNLTSPAIDLSGYSAPALSFWHDLVTEGAAGADEGRVLIEDQANPGIWTEELLTLLTQNWTKARFDLAAYAGKTIKVRFYFDTIDYYNNLFKGWSVDRFYVFGSQEANDVAVLDFSAPNYALPTDNVNVGANIFNLGQSAEDNATNGVDAWLRIDGVYSQVDNIPSIPLGGSQAVNFIWVPGATGDYEVCIHAWPVAGETATANNLACKTIKVRDQPVKNVFVVRSYGTKMGPAIATWLDLNANWDAYGVTPVEIDYQALNKTGITYGDIAATGADVLVISASASLGAPQAWSELALSEVSAIRQYIFEGHGLVATASTFFWSIPNNNGLTDMFGIVDQPYDMEQYPQTTVTKLDALHPLLTNVPSDPFEIGSNVSTVPRDDSRWNASDLLSGGEYVAMSDNNTTTLVVFERLVYFSWMPEFFGNTVDLQILYNAMVWSQYVPVTHDVAMLNLIGPNLVKPTPVMDITATLSNLASVVEDNATNGIDVLLTEDGVVVDSTNIPTLGVGASQDITLTWDPPDLPVPNTYNICMEAYQVSGETDTSNNKVCKDIDVVSEDIVIIVILDSWGTDNPGLAPWDDLNANWAAYGQYEILIDYTTLDKEDFTLLDLIYSSADVLMISTSNSSNDPAAEFTSTELTAIQTYVGMGHGILGTGLTLNSDYLIANIQLAPLFGLKSGITYTNTTGVTSYQKIDPGHTIFFQIPNDPFTTASGISSVPGAEWDASVLLPGAEYIGKSEPTPSEGAMVGNKSTNFRGIYLSNAHEITSNLNDRQILYNAMIWASGRDMWPPVVPDAPRELWISVQGDALQLDWIVDKPEAEVHFNIFRSLTVDGFNFAILHDRVAAPPYLDASPTGVDSNNYYYVVRAINITSGLFETNTNKVGKFYNKLHKGTNDISIPFELQDTSVDVVFADIVADITRVSIFDTATGTWLAWIPGVGGPLRDVDRTMGIRVVSTRNNLDFITVGRVSQSTDIGMTIGMSQWFFVGYPCFKTYPLPDILDSNGLAGLYALVLYYDPTDRRAPWKWFDPNDPGGSPLQVLETGKGYWINLNINGTWTVPGE
ncbi:MAG: hypothetical protein E3J35_01080 [Methanomassiliicoccales archaeon]|nr:MAG: hypothetical protein E3J35_01080 [Methanomassiliicoccales archaeon]